MKPITILAVLLALYSLCGFLLLPLVGKRVVQSHLQQKVSPTATIGKLAFNPFTLRLQVEELKIPSEDGSDWIELQLGVVDLSASTLLEWHLVFDQIELVGPSIEYRRVALAESTARPSTLAWRELVHARRC